jgi:catecholate siderophore receptor
MTCSGITASADPKFNKPLVDTTRTITVIPEQVIKDQGVTNLTDARVTLPISRMPST